MPTTSNPIGTAGDGFVHLVPLGEFHHPESGKLQVIDGRAVEAILHNFKVEATKPRFAGLLVDQDHFSYDLDKSSESYGWVKELAKGADGIWGRIEFSDLGEQAVKNRRYKFVSPVFNQFESLDAKRVRPLRLDSVGLTNNPNLKGMEPLANRKPGDAGIIKLQDPDPSLPLLAANVLTLLASRELGALGSDRVRKVRDRYPLLNRAASHERLYLNHSYHHCISLGGRDQVLVDEGASELRQLFDARDTQEQSCRTDLPFYAHPSQLFEYGARLMNEIRGREGIDAAAAFARLEDVHPLLYVNLCLNQRLGRQREMGRLSP